MQGRSNPKITVTLSAKPATTKCRMVPVVYRLMRLRGDINFFLFPQIGGSINNNNNDNRGDSCEDKMHQWFTCTFMSDSLHIQNVTMILNQPKLIFIVRK
jgi:hypothetical protein